MRTFFILALLGLVGWSHSQRCPSKYKRFTTQHTFCISPNRACQVKQTGVSQQDKELIIRLHNELRSKVAMGKEHGSMGGSLPQAADMMQVEWDDELAAVAQKWTENCYWDHDCNDCRAVENFGVGQNLAITNYDPCYGNCRDPNPESDWAPRIAKLYGEVKDYHRSWLARYMDHPGPMTGHFTQLIWAKSWRVGCGYAFYKIQGAFHKYYACNYGPGGNTDGKPVYEQGRPCSGCPTNSQCSTSSRGSNSFPGLCKMNNPNTAPEFTENPNGLLFYCGPSKNDPDCKAAVSGDGSWNTVRSVGGNYDSIVLKGGQSTTVSFAKTISPHGRRFCLRPTFRKGPLDASKADQSVLQLDFKMGGGMFADPMNLKTKTRSFTDSGINLGWGAKTKVSFTFSVPRGAGKHVLEIRKIIAFDGDCSSR